MISSGADKATKQKALADMQAKRALNAARQAQLAADCSDDDDFAQTAGALLFHHPKSCRAEYIMLRAQCVRL